MRIEMADQVLRVNDMSEMRAEKSPKLSGEYAFSDPLLTA
jgi:hypothetical protein